MPILIVEQPGKRTGGPITGRVLIGRLPTNGIVVTDSSVSRLHAWIDTDQDGNYFVADGGSLTGTIVNGRAIAKRRLLADGDVIRTGLAQIVFSLDDQLPDEVRWIDLGGLPPGENIEEAGVLFDCPCGAPVWFKAAAVGQTHICRHCGRTVLIPGTPGAVAETISVPEIAEPGMPPAGHDSTSAYAYAPVEASSHPVEENGLAEAVSSEAAIPLFEHGISEERQPIADPHEPLFAEPIAVEEIAAPAVPEPTPLFDRSSVALADATGEGLDAALQTHGEYSVDRPSNGDALQAFGFSEHHEAEGNGDGLSEEVAPVRDSLFQHPHPQPVEILPHEPSAETSHAASETTVDQAIPSIESLADETPIAIGELVAAPTIEHTCSICHSPIAAGEGSTACPSCGLTFHADCWQENFGCSAYGCAQVGVLKPAEPEAIETEAADAAALEYAPPEDEELETASFPWESLFLVVSVAGSLMGALAYGVPAVIGAIGTAIYLAAFQESRKRRIVAVVALLVCMLGAGGGVYVSYLWWNGWPMLGPVHHGGAQ